jgi:hypothetical protein
MHTTGSITTIGPAPGLYHIPNEISALCCNIPKRGFGTKKASLAERPGGGWKGREVGVYLVFTFWRSCFCL